MTVSWIFLTIWMSFPGMGETGQPFDPHGIWIVKKTVAYSDITGMNETGARKLTGKKLIIEASDRFSFDGLTVQHIQFKPKRWKADNDFYLAFRVGADELGFPLDQEFTVIDAGMTQIIPRGANDMLFEWQGVWFAAARQASGRKSAGMSSSNADALAGVEGRSPARASRLRR